MRAIALLLLMSCAAGEARTAEPVVLELFTSQGCSSCPPADALLSELARDRSVIALAYHVDYWNHLGWRDPFSSAQWSRRQQQYAHLLKSQVYTPQLVVNGRAQLVGSSSLHVRSEIDRQRSARKSRGSVRIDRITRAGNSLTIDLASTIDSKANVVDTLFENGIATEVKRGENANRRLVNDAIVRWQGNAATSTLTIPLDPTWKHLGVAAFLQDPRSLEIYAATARRIGE